jgi:hypothetical protein
MSEYGIEIKNIYGEIILDNTPYSVMQIVDGYPKSAARNISINDPIFNCLEGEVVFVRASNDGTVGGSAGYENVTGISTGSGDLSYVKLVSCQNNTASGYGLAVYAAGTNKPQMVFNDNMKFVKLVYAGYLSLPKYDIPGGTVVDIAPVSEGMHRYISLRSFGLCGTYNSDDKAGVFTANFGTKTATLYETAVGFSKKSFAADYQLARGITIIEC